MLHKQLQKVELEMYKRRVFNMNLFPGNGACLVWTEYTATWTKKFKNKNQ